MANVVDTSKELKDIGEAEWRVRCDLAAAFQLCDLYGMSDLAATHLSARVPGPEDHFLINPYGTLFDQITASMLLKVDGVGNCIDGDSSLLNLAGFVIHSAIHLARPSLICAVHTHTVANMAVSAMQDGLMPITQKALVMLPFVSYHAYEGVATDTAERERIVEDLGPDGRVLVLRNHGGLTVGESIGEAWVWMYRLEMVCRMQIAATACLGGGLELSALSADVVDLTMQQGKALWSRGGRFPAGTEWPSLLRKLERECGSSYRT